MTPFLNITAVARRTGVPADTLRKWEQRYGILQPVRSQGGHRRYSDLDVSRVEWLRARLSEGYRIGEAAALLDTTPGTVPSAPAKLADALYAAVAANDPAGVAGLLDQTFAVHKLDHALTTVIVPLLERIGDGWAAGEISVAQEHAASAEIRARLERLLADNASGPRGLALLACAPGERHELGLLMLGVVLRVDGWRVVYLGADTPTEAAVAMGGVLGARVLCLSAAMSERIEALQTALESTAVPQELRIVAGGRAVTPAVARALGASPADSSLPRAVARLRKLRA